MKKLSISVKLNMKQKVPNRSSLLDFQSLEEMVLPHPVKAEEKKLPRKLFLIPKVIHHVQDDKLPLM